jgi:NAD-dependent dihydropyrimidine dehydrogenase PreA subunit
VVAKVAVSGTTPSATSPGSSAILGGVGGLCLTPAPVQHRDPSSGGPLVQEDTDVTYVIAQPCVDLKDKACIEECPVDCIYEGERMLYIHPDECVDCGACEPVCPVEAIYYEDDTPEQWADYYKANVEFFDDLGSPGGAAKLGLISKDHPLVAALPPQEHEES